MPADVRMLTAADLAALGETRLAGLSGVVLERPGYRGSAFIVQARAVPLVKAFRSPSTVAEAVVKACVELEDPRPFELLDESYALLSRLYRGAILVPADSAPAPLAASYQPGDQVAGFVIQELATLMVDTEVYRAKTPDGRLAALKLARSDAEATVAAFHHEVLALRALAACAGVELLGHGVLEGRQWLATTWAGDSVAMRAADLRRRGEWDALRELLSGILCRYVALHRQGVLHGDVHPGNVLVDDQDRTSVIDFAWARVPGIEPRERAGVPFYWEPEYARAALADEAPPQVTELSEQHAVGVLLYWLLTGAYPFDFPLEEKELFRTIAESTPLPLRTHGAVPFPELEAPLFRALNKAAPDRYPCLQDMLSAFRGCSSPAQIPGPSARGEQAIDELLRSARPGGRLDKAILTPPTATVNLGAAGVAYALLRIAKARECEATLALAEHWSFKAERLARLAGAFEGEGEIAPVDYDRASAHHGEAGVWMFQAQLAEATGEARAYERAVARLIECLQADHQSVDPTTGAPSGLIAASVLLEQRPTEVDLAEAARASALRLELAVAETPAISSLEDYGMAHGRSGLAYALLRVARATALRPDAWVDRMVEEIAEVEAVMGARGDSELGWCNGAAGRAQFWLLAWEVYGDARFHEMALANGRRLRALEGPSGDLCCGFAGRAYALLELHRSTGDGSWLRDAKALLGRALSGTSWVRRDTLFRGEIGVALLAADIQDPARAFMPLHERRAPGQKLAIAPQS
jgi:serine/threonine-protein kinase